MKTIVKIANYFENIIFWPDWKLNLIFAIFLIIIVSGHDLQTVLQFVFLCRLHGDEIRGWDAADVWSVLHSPVVWWRQTVLVRLLRVRQDHAQGEDAECYTPQKACSWSERLNRTHATLAVLFVQCWFLHLCCLTPERVCTNRIFPWGDQKPNVQVFDTKVRQVSRKNNCSVHTQRQTFTSNISASWLNWDLIFFLLKTCLWQSRVSQCHILWKKTLRLDKIWFYILLLIVSLTVMSPCRTVEHSHGSVPQGGGVRCERGPGQHQLREGLGGGTLCQRTAGCP